MIFTTDFNSFLCWLIHIEKSKLDAKEDCSSRLIKILDPVMYVTDAIYSKASPGSVQNKHRQ